MTKPMTTKPMNTRYGVRPEQGILYPMPFPIIMLSRERAYPSSEFDVIKIYRSLRNGKTILHETIFLVGAASPNKKDWVRYGWEIVEGSVSEC